MQQQASGVAGPFACYLVCTVKHEHRLLLMCVQGRTVFLPGSAMVKDHPIEMMRALPFEHCVQFMSEHIPEEVRHLTMKTSCNFDLSL